MHEWVHVHVRVRVRVRVRVLVCTKVLLEIVHIFVFSGNPSVTIRVSRCNHSSWPLSQQKDTDIVLRFSTDHPFYDGSKTAREEVQKGTHWLSPPGLLIVPTDLSFTFSKRFENLSGGSAAEIIFGNFNWTHRRFARYLVGLSTAIIFVATLLFKTALFLSKWLLTCFPMYLVLCHLQKGSAVVTNLERWPWKKSGSFRRALSCSLERPHFVVWWAKTTYDEKLHILFYVFWGSALNRWEKYPMRFLLSPLDTRPRAYWPFRKPQRIFLCIFSKTVICVQSMPSG